MKAFVAIFVAIGTLQPAVPPDSVSLQYCYEQAFENYPIAKKRDLQKQITELNIRIVNTGNYPDISLNGKASYQSEVTEFGMPGSGGFPSVSKDQYEAALNITQNIFNGGSVGIRKKLEQARGDQEIHSTEVEFHKIRSQIDQVYYGILLSRKKQETNKLFLEELQKRLETVRSRVENGALLPSQQRILKAEIIKARQDSAEIRSDIEAGYRVLSELVGKEIQPEVMLTLPEMRPDLQAMSPQRPEYDLFQSTRAGIEHQKELAKTKKLPAISAFGSAAYGRPGLNFLNDDFHDYYMVGVRLRWNFWDFLNADREQEVLQIQQSKVMQDQRAFTKQLNASLSRLDEKMSVIRKNIRRDREIIELRNQVAEEGASQLKNGVITATEYVTELTHARQAELSLMTNRIRLIQVQTEYATLLGLPFEELFESKSEK